VALPSLSVGGESSCGSRRWDSCKRKGVQPRTWMTSCSSSNSNIDRSGWICWPMASGVTKATCTSTESDNVDHDVREGAFRDTAPGGPLQQIPRLISQSKSSIHSSTRPEKCRGSGAAFVYTGSWSLSKNGPAGPRRSRYSRGWSHRRALIVAEVFVVHGDTVGVNIVRPASRR
jgi:hypothetical protein